MSTAMEIVREDEREDTTVMPDRRESGWRDPRFWLAFIGVLVTLATGAWAVARNVAIMSNNVTEMRTQLSGIDSKLTALTLANNSQEKELEFLKKEVAELKTDWKADKDLQDTWIKNTREQIIELKARR